MSAADKHSDAIAHFLARRGHQITFVNTEFTGEQESVQYVRGEYVTRRGYPFHLERKCLTTVLSHQPQYDIVHHFGTEGSIFERWREENTHLPKIPSVCSLWASRTAPLGVTSQWGLLFRGKPFRFLAVREESYAAKKADLVTVASASMQRQVQVEHHIPAEKIHVIPRGTDVKFFAQHVEPYKNPKGGPVIMTAARLDREKGVGVLIQAMVKVVQEIPGAFLYIVGDGPCRLELEEMAKSLNLQNLKFTGRVAQEEVRRYYHSCDIFALCSHFKPFGAVIIEAACAGKPAIVANRGGPAEIVVHEKTGLLVNPEDPNEIAESILKLASDPQRLRQYGEAAKHRVTELYSFEHEAENYEYLYEQLIR